jgi:hypothetical protein
MKGKYIKLFFAALLTFVFIAFGTGASLAYDIRTGHFQVQVYDWAGTPISTPALNDGYRTPGGDGPWFQYPQPANSPIPPPWWNEWWYNDPYRMGGKWIQLEFDWQPIIPQLQSDLNVTINWTNGEWTGRDAPPIGAIGFDPEQYIVRLPQWVFHADIPAPGAPISHFDSGVYWLPINYNPEWVSVDVRGANVNIWNGTLDHQCVGVPEPATMTLLLLGFGLTGLAGWGRKLNE